jgi:hypothetical protein
VTPIVSGRDRDRTWGRAYRPATAFDAIPAPPETNVDVNASTDAMNGRIVAAARSTYSRFSPTGAT